MGTHRLCRDADQRKAAVTFIDNRPKVGPPKSAAGIRTIPLLKPLADILNKQAATEGFLIGGDKPWTESTFQRAWERIKKTIDLHGATPHVFRHSFLTALNGEGLNPKEIQAIGGHADVRMTMEIHIHAGNEQIKNAAQKMTGIFRLKHDLLPNLCQKQCFWKKRP